MKRSMVSLFILVVAAFFPAEAQSQYPRVQYVGIPSGQMDFFVASQEESQWCWAASIQMVLNYYGVSIDQAQIVRRTYGTDPYGILPDWGGSFQAITANLNNWSMDNYGRYYRVIASVYSGPPDPSVLIQELSQGRPIIIGYQNGYNSGHAIVITAVGVIPTYAGPMVQTIVARDPWPSAENILRHGRVEYNATQFASLIQAHWYVRVQPL